MAPWLGGGGPAEVNTSRPGKCGKEVHGSPPAGLACNLQFRYLFPEDPTDQILSNILMLISSKRREVAGGAALSSFKDFVASKPILSSTKFVSSIED